MRKLLTRTLTLCTIGLLVYFVIISDDTGKIPTEEAAEGLPTASAMSLGEDVKVTTFDLDGKRTSVGTFASVTQNLKDNKIFIEKPDVTYTTRDGRVIQVKADFLDSRENEEQVLSSADDNLILVQEQDGITIQTPGPLVYDPRTETLYTEARSEFSMGNFNGACTGLLYRSAKLLRLKSDVFFSSDEDDGGHLFMDAAFLELDLLERLGKMDKGLITAENGPDRTLFQAEHSRFHFIGDGEEQPYTLTDLSLEGSPARFQWNQGEMEASRFDGCFDSSGQWLENFSTSADATFTAISEDGYWFNGQGGRMVMTAMTWEPQSLVSRDAITLIGRKGGGPDLYLEGNEGLETVFKDGTATSTRIFGRPQFTYGNQEGLAGSLRVLHQEHQILFSQSAELRDRGQEVFIKGDEILLADWDKPRREIFAFKFVEITQFEGTPNAVSSYGDEMELRLPGGSLKLGGSPAKVVRSVETIEGNIIEIKQLDGELFDLEAAEGATLNMITEEGTFWAEARKMNYYGRKRLLTFDNVTKVVVPERGELSGGLLEAWLERDGDSLRLDRVRMSEDVIFKGSRLVEDVRRPIFCQADEMTYKVSEEVIYFHGINRDVVFSDAQVETRNRDLKYDLRDGSLSGYAARNRPSTTTVPLGKANKKTNNPFL